MATLKKMKRRAAQEAKRYVKKILRQSKRTLADAGDNVLRSPNAIYWSPGIAVTGSAIS